MNDEPGRFDGGTFWTLVGLVTLCAVLGWLVWRTKTGF